MFGNEREEMKSYVTYAIDLSLELMPKIAKVYAQLYKSLIEEGFTKKQALEICGKYQVNNK